jgi:hypothetical protein
MNNKKVLEMNDSKFLWGICCISATLMYLEQTASVLQKLESFGDYITFELIFYGRFAPIVITLIVFILGRFKICLFNPSWYKVYFVSLIFFLISFSSVLSIRPKMSSFEINFADSDQKTYFNKSVKAELTYLGHRRFKVSCLKTDVDKVRHIIKECLVTNNENPKESETLQKGDNFLPKK